MKNGVYTRPSSESLQNGASCYLQLGSGRPYIALQGICVITHTDKIFLSTFGQYSPTRHLQMHMCALVQCFIFPPGGPKCLLFMTVAGILCWKARQCRHQKYILGEKDTGPRSPLLVKYMTQTPCVGTFFSQKGKINPNSNV